MTVLRFEAYTIPAASLGADNPLPALSRNGDGNAKYNPDPSIPKDEQRYFGWRCSETSLPYRTQDGYDRNRRPRDFAAAVLESETLRATFLPEIGGRLWSLIHKPTGRELLYVNPVFQPANLAIRNAWFSGGVEWNPAVVGHTAFTCSPIFAARAVLEDGTPVLRLYEYERTRGLTYQIDAWLPRDAAVLVVRVRLTNPNREETPGYWWSNIAAPETPDTRVIVPADSAISSTFAGSMSVVSIPTPSVKEGSPIDVTYPARCPMANDFFFRIPEGRRRFIAALRGDGMGLVQSSTDRLRGRKLFVWGQGPGGKRWQRFLTEPGETGRPYLEIQAGLARTQYECFPMSPGENIEWLETYGLARCDPKRTHGSDYLAAIEEVEHSLESQAPRAWVEAELELTRAMSQRPPAEIVQRGSGWGALEERRRRKAGEPALGGGVQFSDDTLGPEQMPWVILQDTGVLPKLSVRQEPGAWMIQKAWRAMLEESVRNGRGTHWLSWLHLGVMRYQAGEFNAAAEAWHASLRHDKSGWAWRNLGVLAVQDKRPADAVEPYLNAVRLLPEQARLVIEALDVCYRANETAKMVEIMRLIPPAVKQHPRVRLLGGFASLAMGDWESVERLLKSDVELADLREGETALTDLWFALHEKRLAAEEGVEVDASLRDRVRSKYPPPPELDFRMMVKAQ